MNPVTSKKTTLCEYRQSARLMGNRFEFTIVADDIEWANEMTRLAISEVQRIEVLLTTYNENSQTCLINQQAGISAVKVDREVFELIRRSLRISAITDGAFDITYGSIDRQLWNFDTTMKALPDPETAKRSVRLINYRNVILDEADCSVYLREKGMRIGFGGIGKGYAAEQVRRLLQQHGVQSGIVNASGDLATWGTQADGRPWTIGISNPDQAELPFSYMNISGLAVATSGNYEKFITVKGKRYSHTINPRTGLPVTGIKSVTIICPNAELADAMATPVTIMGVKAGLMLVNQLEQMACIIIDDNNRIYTSKNIQLT
ncbi:FAD:protein FMN transferase [Flavihumibacter solisilvae]|uniref:FAD:protein FMN transferase n=1 Tax=Flavihumibacter solisilvae TaxID=1349421 RepID=A0A0C1I9S8_9BACT|nr:FAD:protein FMN transferase [Flavihumibacter solisilvae]KIC90770.1 thiamine biosynthesis protein ApbE [Flavihumibacter solisilvae]